MSRSRRQASRGLVLLGFCLVVLANLGLQAHSDHHSLAADHAGATTLFVADHVQPDPSLHLDNVTETRTLVCPGCLLQHQLGGSHLLDLRGLDRPAATGALIEPPTAVRASRSVTGNSPRAPPLLLIHKRS